MNYYELIDFHGDCGENDEYYSLNIGKDSCCNIEKQLNKHTSTLISTNGKLNYPVNYDDKINVYISDCDWMNEKGHYNKVVLY